ncbi:MAG TPA: hypothetical protein VKF82_04030 [Candidatus Eremiobacteraceae bacterium]|nr:hypothetical protein [Candidatus Eremiobacteraceae bacterium]
MAHTLGTRTQSLAAILALALVAPPAVVWGYARGGGGGGYHSPYSGHATTSGADFSGDSAADHTSASHYDDSADYSHSYNGSNSAGAYNKNTGNGATYNKNTGTTTTYNKNTNTVNQYHTNTGYNNNYNHNYSGYSNYHYNGSNYYVTNPHGYSTWGWHGGTVWYPTSSYWGGGFWGAFAVGAVVAGTTAAIIAASQPSYPTTYVVVQSSPGYTLLSSYGLRQVPCGPNLVVINYSGSVICAAPNATVAPGNYSVNIGTLTLVST